MNRAERAGVSRRAFLEGGTLFLLAGTAGDAAELPGAEPALKIGLITDVHYADTPPRGSRFYRESVPKMAEAVEALNRQKVRYTVELGDFIDALDTPDADSEARFLERINREFSRLKGGRRYVPGNHCVYSLTKRRFLDTVGQREAHFAFDAGGFHFVGLDACYRRDGVAYGNRNNDWTDTDIPAHERDWLAADLKATALKTVVFVHQRLDLPVGDHYTIHSAPAVREILEGSGKVIAVFQGHSHRNDYRAIRGIHYATLHALIEGAGPADNAYSVLNLFADGGMTLTGFRRHADHPLAQRRRQE